ncbi:MAG: hypothetical protein M3Z24_13500, partial [Chloroflexota bacterium]|nr:hypothetical protein [Chloroflexota bacterium]
MLTTEVTNYLKKTLRVDKLSLPQIEALPFPLLEITEQIAALTGSWNPVEIFTPDNARVERAKFIEAFHANQVYNPQFTYSYAEKISLGDSRKILNELCRQVKQLTPRSQIERLARVALYFKIGDDLATCDLVEGIQAKDEEQIGRALKQKYPGTDQELLKIAEADYIYRISGDTDTRIEQQGILTQQEINYLRNKEFDAIEIKKAFIWAIDEYRIKRSENNKKGFLVVIDEKVTSIDVRDKSINGPTIFIPVDRKVNGINLVKLIGHEIDGHARQSVNGEKLFLIGGGALKIDDEILYEGLAKRYDDFLSAKLFGTSEGVPMPYYTYAVYAAERGGPFYDIFREQLN